SCRLILPECRPSLPAPLLTSSRGQAHSEAISLQLCRRIIPVKIVRVLPRLDHRPPELRMPVRVDEMDAALVPGQPVQPPFRPPAPVEIRLTVRLHLTP